MKRAIAALSILCGGLLFINPVSDIVFAQHTNNSSNTEVVENVQVNNTENVLNKEEIKEEVKETETKKETIAQEEVKEQEVEQNKEEVKEEIVKQNEEATQEQVNNEDKVVENVEVEVPKEENIQNDTIEENKNVVEVIDVLNKQEAEELLKIHNGEANYTYQGDENDFEVLSQKGFSGYVFLPDYETDLGFFVDENNGDIYYFHPSGYMNLAI